MASQEVQLHGLALWRVRKQIPGGVIGRRSIDDLQIGIDMHL